MELGQLRAVDLGGSWVREIVFCLVWWGCFLASWCACGCWPPAEPTRCSVVTTGWIYGKKRANVENAVIIIIVIVSITRRWA